MDDYLMTVGKIVCDLVHVFDWCFYIPIAIHKDDRDVTSFRGAEFIANVRARPDSCRCHVAGKILPRGKADCRIDGSGLQRASFHVTTTYGDQNAQR